MASNDGYNNDSGNNGGKPVSPIVWVLVGAIIVLLVMLVMVLMKDNHSSVQVDTPVNVVTPATNPPAAHVHSWSSATCTSPETCYICGATKGSATGHIWSEATYDRPKTCTRCGATEGSKLTRSVSDVSVIQEANGTSDYWSIQVSSSGSEKNSKIVAERMRETGYNAFVYHRPGSPTYKIMVGIFKNKSDATATVQKIRTGPEVRGLKDIEKAYEVEIKMDSANYSALKDPYM